MGLVNFPLLISTFYEDSIKKFETQYSAHNTYEYIYSEENIKWIGNGEKITEKQLKELRNNIITFLNNEKSNHNPLNTSFDLKLGDKLLEWINITPSLAAETGVWAYLNIILVPELVHERWLKSQDKNESKSYYDRFFDKNRNYLGKLWWQAKLSIDKNGNSVITDLGITQDELDSWADRTRTRGLQGYINTVYQVFMEQHKEKNFQEKSKFFREVIKIVNRKLGYLNYYSICDSNLLKNITENAIQEAEIEYNKKQNDLYTLNADFKDLKLNSIQFGENEKEDVSTWVTFQEKVLLHLYNLDPNKFFDILNTPSVKGSRPDYGATADEIGSRAIKLVDGFYFSSNYNRDGTIQLIKRLLKFFNLDESILKIYCTSL